jgi:hypothetical protein
MRKTIAALVVMLSLAASVHAEPVTAGQLTMDWRGAGSLSFSCLSGLTFTGSVNAMDGVFPSLQLDPTTGSPGQAINVSGYWTGLAVRGAVVDHQETIPVGQLDSDNWGDVRFMTEVNAPLTGDEVAITAPFEFLGTFSLRNQPISMTGFGRATVWLQRFQGDDQTPSYWDFRSVTYAFEPQTDLTPNPEPATMLLGLTGLGMVWLRKQRSL